MVSWRRPEKPPLLERAAVTAGSPSIRWQTTGNQRCSPECCAPALKHTRPGKYGLAGRLLAPRQFGTGANQPHPGRGVMRPRFRTFVERQSEVCVSGHKSARERFLAGNSLLAWQRGPVILTGVSPFTYCRTCRPSARGSATRRPTASATPPRRQTVDVRRIDPLVALAVEVHPAEVVDEDENDVRLFCV